MSTLQIVGFIITAISAYLIGSLNFAIILSKLTKEGDIRQFGSGNAGMTNMLRIYGKKLAFFTGLGDVLKGVAAVLLARFVIYPLFDINQLGLDVGYFAGIFVLIGHVYPVFYGFKGGKGVLTTAGVLLTLDPAVFLILLVVGLVIILITRTVSLGSITGAILLPLFTFLSRWLRGRPFWFDLITTTIIAGFVVYLHRSNISRLLSGTENRFEKKPKNNSAETPEADSEASKYKV